MRILLLASVGLALAATPTLAAAQGFSAREVSEEIRERAQNEYSAFYEARGYRPVWVVNGRLSNAAEAFLDHVSQAEIDGLSVRDFNPRELREMARETDDDEDRIARAELRFMQEFVDYVRQMRRPSDSIHYSSAYLSRMPEAREVLDEAARARDFNAYVREMQWMSPLYTQLREAVLSEENNSRDTLAWVPGGPALRKGDQNERVRLLRERLGLLGGDYFDEELAEALQRFQSGRGLNADGIAGERTLAALNGTGANLSAVLRINLERARPLPGPWTRHVLVNAATAQLSYYGEGDEQGSMKVIVGTSETPTPIMAGMLQFATVNPYWNVPVSLARKNIAPAILRGASLDRMGYEALSSWDEDARVISQDSVDWRAVADGSEQVRLRQLPSSRNAMGKVKYLFPNDLGIYLHDTPERRLFAEHSRQFSNGCVRLEDAERLGEWLFDGPIEGIEGSPEQHIVLPVQVPVFITYLTAVPSNGTIAFTSDVYNLDDTDSSMLASR